MSESLPPNPPGPARVIRSATWWWIASALAAGLILGMGGLELFRLLARPLSLMVLAVTIATALAPVVERLDKRIHHALAVVLVYAAMVLIIVGIIGSTVPFVFRETRGLARQFETLRPQISQMLSEIGFDPASLANPIVSEIGRLGSAVLMLPFTLASSLVQFVFVIFLSLYWLLTMPAMKAFFLSFFPGERRGFVSGVIGQMGTAMGGYMRGSAINGLIVGVLEYVGLLIIGVPYAIALGALAGLMEFFPTIGPVISGTVATIAALSVSPQTALITVIFAIVLQQTEGHILVPLIMRSQTAVSPVLAIFAVVSGAAIGGLLGAVIAIPVVSALSVLIRMVIAPALRKANGVDDSQSVT